MGGMGAFSSFGNSFKSSIQRELYHKWTRIPSNGHKSSDISVIRAHSFQFALKNKSPLRMLKACGMEVIWIPHSGAGIQV